MLAGRKGLVRGTLASVADQAEDWLRKEFAGKDLMFYTGWDTRDRTITLRVFRKFKSVAGGYPVHFENLLFEITEPADVFITHTTLTKIILVS